MSTSTSILFVTLVLVVVCTANLATGRASLRPSAGKRSSGAVLVGRTPAHYYRIADAQQFENELTCSLSTMSVLNARYEQLQEEIEELVSVMEACHTLRAAL